MSSPICKLAQVKGPNESRLRIRGNEDQGSGFSEVDKEERLIHNAIVKASILYRVAFYDK